MTQHLADIWSAPVSTSLDYQYAGGTPTFRFEGRVHMAFPDGLSLKKRSAALPNMVEVSAV